MASNADESSQDETEDTEAAETKPAATEAASKDDKNGGTAATDVLAAAKKEPGKSESSEVYIEIFYVLLSWYFYQICFDFGFKVNLSSQTTILA